MVVRRVRSKLSLLAATVFLAVVSTPAYSLDLLTLFLLRIVRDKVISVGIEAAAERASAAAAPPVATQPSAPVLPLGMDDTQLQRLIDEGFVHLSASQRREVYESVQRILLDPKNAAEAPAIIADLAIKASAVRQAHESLSNLSTARKQRIAVETREAYEKMPPETREDLATAIRARVVPMPTDLTDMILAEFDRVRAQVATERAEKPPKQE